MHRKAPQTLYMLLALACAGCVQAPPDADSDIGGNLAAYLAEVDRLNQQRLVKRITGRCASACTAFLGVDRVCVSEEAELWFHAARVPGTDAPDPVGSLKLLSYYPPRVRRWAIHSGGLEELAWSDAKMLTGRQLIAMGLPECGK